MLAFIAGGRLGLRVLAAIGGSCRARRRSHGGVCGWLGREPESNGWPILWWPIPIRTITKQCRSSEQWQI